MLNKGQRHFQKRQKKRRVVLVDEDGETLYSCFTYMSHRIVVPHVGAQMMSPEEAAVYPRSGVYSLRHPGQVTDWNAYIPTYDYVGEDDGRRETDRSQQGGREIDEGQGRGGA